MKISNVNNDDLEFDELSLYIVFRDSPRDGYTSEHGHQITPFQKRPMGHVKGASLWTKRPPYSRFVSRFEKFVSRIHV